MLVMTMLSAVYSSAITTLFSSVRLSLRALRSALNGGDTLQRLPGLSMLLNP
ncbi:hypothetical protein Q0M94_21250 (plasmid) [Deinococcus radiomollis]|uniref:hypothetical protein n=1 Tax=Deinococcus radiomollis TaxID=468916 RepID=UPI003891EE97